MKTILIIIVSFLLSQVASAEEWVNKKLVDTYLRGVNFPSDQIGFVCGENKIFFTDNGGTSWQIQNTGLSQNQMLYSITFYNNSIGYAVGNNGLVIKTVNGGETWTNISPSSVTRHFRSIVFLSEESVIVSGTSGVIYKTTNGGASWTNYSVLTNSTFFKVISADNVCYTTGQQTDLAFAKSLDEGHNWSLTPIANFTGYSLTSNGEFLHFVGRTPAGKLAISRSSDGQNWQQQVFQEEGVIIDAMFVNSSVGYAMATMSNSQSRIYKTVNGGLNWQEAGTFTTSLTKIFCTPSTIYAVGDSGNIYSSAIPVGVTTNSIDIPQEFKLSQNYPNPFNPSTKINFSLPKSGMVKLSVYDVNGKQVTVLLDESMTAGNYSVDFNGSNNASGTYFYKIETKDFAEVKRMMLIK